MTARQRKRERSARDLDAVRRDLGNSSFGVDNPSARLREANRRVEKRKRAQAR